MILWVDAQLSPALAPWITQQFGIEAYSAKSLGYRDATDWAIFQTAREAGVAVITKDADFVHLLDQQSDGVQSDGVKSCIPTKIGYDWRMARALRIELAGGLYHVTSRGDRREDIFLSDEDRDDWVELVGEVCARFNWRCQRYK